MPSLIVSYHVLPTTHKSYCQLERNFPGRNRDRAWSSEKNFARHLSKLLCCNFCIFLCDTVSLLTFSTTFSFFSFSRPFFLLFCLIVFDRLLWLSCSVFALFWTLAPLFHRRKSNFPVALLQCVGLTAFLSPGAKISFPWRPEASSTEKLPDKLISEQWAWV